MCEQSNSYSLHHLRDEESISLNIPPFFFFFLFSLPRLLGSRLLGTSGGWGFWVCSPGARGFLGEVYGEVCWWIGARGIGGLVCGADGFLARRSDVEHAVSMATVNTNRCANTNPARLLLIFRRMAHGG